MSKLISRNNNIIKYKAPSQKINRNEASTNNNSGLFMIKQLPKEYVLQYPNMKVTTPSGQSVSLREALDPTCWVYLEDQDKETLNLTCSEHFDDLYLDNIDIKYINGELVIDVPPTYGTIKGSYIKLNENKKPQKYYITVLM